MSCSEGILVACICIIMKYLHTSYIQLHACCMRTPSWKAKEKSHIFSSITKLFLQETKTDPPPMIKSCQNKPMHAHTIALQAFYNHH